MTKASDLAFIRTQAEIFAWASIAADSLVEMGVLDPQLAFVFAEAADILVALAREDPKFIGDKLPAEFK